MKSSHREQGFTLVELLIVIFIMSIVTSVALLTVSRNKDKQLESFVNEFKQTVTLAEEQAMLQPMIIGLSFKQASYQFASYQSAVEGKKASWLPMQDSLLGQYTIPDGIELVVAGNELQQSAKNRGPQVVISTNGDLTPFKLYVGHEGSKPRYIIQGDADGTVTSQLLS